VASCLWTFSISLWHYHTHFSFVSKYDHNSWINVGEFVIGYLVGFSWYILRMEESKQLIQKMSQMIADLQRIVEEQNTMIQTQQKIIEDQAKLLEQKSMPAHSSSSGYATPPSSPRPSTKEVPKTPKRPLSSGDSERRTSRRSRRTLRKNL